MIAPVYTPLRAVWMSWYGMVDWQEETADALLTPARPNGWEDGGIYRQNHEHRWTSQSPGMPIGRWNNFYSGINAANRVIYQIESGLLALEGETRERTMAELRAMRAYYYSLLLDNFGNVPIVTDFTDAELPEQRSRQEVYDFVVSEFQAVILREQLRRHPQQTEHRSTMWDRLVDQLAPLARLSLPVIDERVTAHGRHLFTFRVSGLGGVDHKKRFVRALAAEGIPVSGGYVGLHRNEAIRSEIRAITERLGRPQPHAELPATDDVVAAAMWLSPQTLLGTPSDAEDIVTAIGKVLDHSTQL
jgi:hypothetical protein